MKILPKNNVYNNKFLVFGHRGVHELVPENTLESFKKAIELKYDGIELDVMLTKDDVLIVHHDKEVRVKSNLEKIIDLGYEDVSAHLSKRPPKLEDVLSCLGHKTNINIEIKDQGLKANHISEKIIKELKKFNLIDNIVISSFSPHIIIDVKKKDDRFSTGWIWGNKNLRFFNCWGIVLKHIKPQAVHVNYSLINDRLIKKIKSYNIKILAYTVNEEKDLLDMMTKKIDGIFTDCPAILKLARKQGL